MSVCISRSPRMGESEGVGLLTAIAIKPALTRAMALDDNNTFTVNKILRTPR